VKANNPIAARMATAAIFNFVDFIKKIW
jgi:hypothetical protein